MKKLKENVMPLIAAIVCICILMLWYVLEYIEFGKLTGSIADATIFLLFSTLLVSSIAINPIFDTHVTKLANYKGSYYTRNHGEKYRWTCPECGFKIKDEYKYCPYCGQRVLFKLPESVINKYKNK